MDPGLMFVSVVGDVEGTSWRRECRRWTGGGRRRWTENAGGAAGQVRSAVADDRRRGAEAGKRPALVARGLFSTVTVVPRVCAPPRRLPSRCASDFDDLWKVFTVLNPPPSCNIMNCFFTTRIPQGICARDASAHGSLLFELRATRNTCVGKNKAASTQAPVRGNLGFPGAG